VSKKSCVFVVGIRVVSNVVFLGWVKNSILNLSGVG
jgi:hypothetical protein